MYIYKFAKMMLNSAELLWYLQLVAFEKCVGQSVVKRATRGIVQKYHESHLIKAAANGKQLRKHNPNPAKHAKQQKSI